MIDNGLAPVPLFNTNGEQIFGHDFETALQTIGIKKGDVLFIHSDLTKFGNLLSFNRNQLLETLIQVFKRCVGDKGSLIMPTFSYSFCKNEIFDVEKTKSTTGVLSEYFRKQPSTQRTIQPIQSCAVWGYDQKSLLLIDKDTFGEKSIFENLFKLKGKIVYFGTSFLISTFNHHIEQMHGVPYRYMKSFKGIISNDNMQYNDEFTFYVRPTDRNVISDSSRFGEYLSDGGYLRKVNIGEGTIETIDSDILFHEGYKKLDEDIFYFLKEKPNL
jgi:aminoglycoside 3-N-acetyltransferase